MYCSKCGSELPPGIDFCPNCGSRVEQPSGAAQPKRSNMPGDNFQALSISKRSKQMIGIAILAAVIVVGGLLAVITTLSSSNHSDTLASPPPSGQLGAAPSPSENVAAPVVSDDEMDMDLPDLFGNNNTYVCLSDGKYFLISDENEDGSTYITESDDKGITYNMVMFSKDKEHIYYYTDCTAGEGTLFHTNMDYSSYAGEGTLWRANSGGSHIETIATSALTGFSELNDGSIVYMDDENALRHWKEGVTTPICDYADHYYTDASGRLVYTIGNDIDGLSIYGVDFNNGGRTVELATNCFLGSQKDEGSHILYTDFDHILYKQTEADGAQTLYEVDFNGKKKKIAEKANVFAYDIANQVSYFVAENGRSVNLYDFVKEKYGQEISNSELRAELQNTANNYPLHTLYRYQNGTLTAISEDVLNIENIIGGMFFNTPDGISPKGDVNSITSAADVRDLFEIDYGDENNILFTDGSHYKMSAGAAKTISEAEGDLSYSSLCFKGDSVYFKNPNGNALFVAPINQGIVGDFSLLTDNGGIAQYGSKGEFYCTYLDDGYDYCDLYLHQGSQNTLLADNIVQENINIYSDGIIMAYTNGRELAMIDSDGKKNIIADDVTQYIRSGQSTLIYISDGDLYLYNGKEKKLLQSNAEYVWSANYVPISEIICYTKDGYDQAKLYLETN